MIGPTNAMGGGGQLKAAIIVTAPTGSVVTISSGSKTKTATEKNGTWTFQRLEFGSWVVTATKGGETATETIEVSDINVYRVTLAYVHIFGIKRDITKASPAWERTDEAVGLTATASVGTVAGHSDFDAAYPWNGITRETLSTGDVMVKIPKFWYRRYREGDVEHIQIADKEAAGFSLHPAFNHGGVEKECVYVGAYKTSSGAKSVSGVAPEGNKTRASMRNGAKGKGTGWGLIDISTVSAIQMLILVEFANNNVQSVIGSGRCDRNSSAANTGTCDSVGGLTGRPAGTDGKVDVVWRGIEGFWGNIREWTDGINVSGGSYYVCNNPADYADGTTTNYTVLSYKGSTSWNNAYITRNGLDTGDNPHVILPADAGGSGSGTTYECDTCYGGTGWRVFARGGHYSSADGAGLFSIQFTAAASDSAANYGSRLMYIPS